MKLKFIDNIDDVTSGAGRKPLYPWAEVVEELYKHPNRWVEFPEKISSSSSAYIAMKRYADIEVRTSGGNNHPKDHPDKLMWTVYLCYVPKGE